MTTALLIVDIQNDYFPGGKMELADSHQAGEQASRLLAYFRQQGWPIVYIQHLATRLSATFFIPGTAGAEIHPCVQTLAGETILQKHYPNSFRETGLLEHLRSLGCQRLVICGMMTHMCIDATTRAAADLGFACLLAHDACATRDLTFKNQNIPASQVHAAFLSALHGSYAQVLTVDELLAAIGKDAT